MSEHTKEPWTYNVSTVRDHTDEYETTVQIVGQGETHVLFLGSDTENPEETARRIVACVNACRGISTESLEAHTIHQMCAQLREEIKAEYYRPGSD